MQPLRAKDITGSWATLLLPINPDESIDFVRLGDELDVLTSAHVSGIYSNGTAGEFYTQSEAEYDRVCQLLSEHCERAEIPFQIGASHSSPQTTLERVRHAKQFAPGAIQVILPDWLTLTNDEAVTYLSRLAEAADPIGLVLYNPPHAKRRLTSAEIGAIHQQVPALVGIKVGGGGPEWFAEMRQHLSQLSVFIPGTKLITALGEGAQGAYSNVACLQPHGAQRWYAMATQDREAALELETRIQAFMSHHITPLVRDQQYTGASADKLLATIGGWADVGTRLRWPYRSLPPTLAEQLRPIAHHMIPELFS